VALISKRIRLFVALSIFTAQAIVGLAPGFSPLQMLQIGRSFTWLDSRMGCKYPVVHMSMMKNRPLDSTNPMTASVRLCGQCHDF
jgi:hypothetical protein